MKLIIVLKDSCLNDVTRAFLKNSSLKIDCLSEFIYLIVVGLAIPIINL